MSFPEKDRADQNSLASRSQFLKQQYAIWDFISDSVHDSDNNSERTHDEEDERVKSDFFPDLNCEIVFLT